MTAECTNSEDKKIPQRARILADFISLRRSALSAGNYSVKFFALLHQQIDLEFELIIDQLVTKVIKE